MASRGKKKVQDLIDSAAPSVAGGDRTRKNRAPKHIGKRVPPPSGRANHSIHSLASRRFLARLRFQLLYGLVIAVGIPTLIASRGDPNLFVGSPSGLYSVIGSICAFLAATYLFRRIASFPGSGILGHVLPALTTAYGVVLIAFFASRLEYSRAVFFGGFGGAISFFLLVSFYIRNRVSQHFYVVPSDNVRSLLKLPNVDWILLSEPAVPQDPQPVFIADLRADLEPQWERLIAEVAVAGHPVYHIKQVQESLTGRVEIEHLSENSFGSLLPNHGYLKVKRALDLIVSWAALPLLILPFLLLAALIKLDTPGPVFFRQPRRGHRGRVFEVVKFRTMAHSAASEADMRAASITHSEDGRITPMGRFLRRSRIDELPQIWNVIRGEMSWIGPRPEALPLSEWYTVELPFYSYRHILRPGVTGWAQVNQGHVADLESVFEKLHYDFYYIKYFSAWLDLLIVIRTISTIFTGSGAR
jgi:lipopolysaccharide/colanic/teichoic acid biosynthesis glycosyltransferase